MQFHPHVTVDGNYVIRYIRYIKQIVCQNVVFDSRVILMSHMTNEQQFS